MKTARNLLTALAAMLILTGAGSALAISSIDIDFIGIGDLGYVGPGESINYHHVFEPLSNPRIDITSVDSTWLYVAVVDDLSCRDLEGSKIDWFQEGEVAAIDLNGAAWKSGTAKAKIFWGDITAEADLLAHQGILDVTISSEQGDFVVAWSKMITKYDWACNAIPEPNAALVFAFGMLIVSQGVRRHHS